MNVDYARCRARNQDLLHNSGMAIAALGGKKVDTSLDQQFGTSSMDRRMDKALQSTLKTSVQKSSGSKSAALLDDAVRKHVSPEMARWLQERASLGSKSHLSSVFASIKPDAKIKPEATAVES